MCNKGFQTSSDLKRHKRTRVHQEKVEQANGGEAGGDSADVSMDKEEGEEDGDDFNQWNEEGEDTGNGEDGVQQASASGKADPAQALLNNITRPAVVAATSAAAAPSVSFAAPPPTPSSSTTIDMKALGGTTAWNNNATSAPPSSAPPTQPAAPPALAPSSSSSSSTLDLKAISGGSTVDINALKWQQQQQQLQQQGNGPQAAAAPSTSGQPMAIKRSSSLDSPVPDEERLTVVEGDDSSQDSNLSGAANATGNGAGGGPQATVS